MDARVVIVAVMAVAMAGIRYREFREMERAYSKFIGDMQKTSKPAQKNLCYICRKYFMGDAAICNQCEANL